MLKHISKYTVNSGETTLPKNRDISKNGLWEINDVMGGFLLVYATIKSEYSVSQCAKLDTVNPLYQTVRL